jgi:alkyl sulfatase BDS1-like metallo-beta-lactamase superfamily hydrolase
MPEYRALDHQMMRSVAFKPEDPAVRITEAILMSPGQSNSYLVASDGGDVVINTGTVMEAERHRERYEQLLGRPLKAAKIVFTQSHNDHMGGWRAFNGPGVETIAHRLYPEGRLDRQRLQPFFLVRGQRALGPLHSPERRRRYFQGTPEAEVTTDFADSHAFEVGARRFELYWMPGGETLDSLAVWLPIERAVFTGNLTGALYGQFPHLYTIRGDRQRSARTFIACIEKLLELQPELLVTGHDEPVRGAERVRRDLTKLRDMVQHVHDETVKGMNEGKDLFTLMREVKLPPELEPAPGRGPIRWYVREIWDEYSGWFRMESTTELCDVAPSAIWPELVELAGGADVIAEHARAHVQAGRPVEALHLTDMVVASEPGHRGARLAQIAALEQLIERTGGRHFDELCWLEGELSAAQAVLLPPAGPSST